VGITGLWKSLNCKVWKGLNQWEGGKL
jgi:hypothetical protein